MGEKENNAENILPEITKTGNQFSECQNRLADFVINIGTCGHANLMRRIKT